MGSQTESPDGFVHLYDLVRPDDTPKVRQELAFVAREVGGLDDRAWAVYDDVESLFEGRYPGYRASNTGYHDLEHTNSVVLASARLVHGGHVQGRGLGKDELTLSVLGSLYHDVGLIQRQGDEHGTGAKYTVGHEERSVDFMHGHLPAKGFEPRMADGVAEVIQCTNLSLQPKSLAFSSPTVRTAGMVVGTADLLAQMADRNYLEKLLLLYKEFEEARLPGFDSELALLQKTEDFYIHIARKRLLSGLDGVCLYMRDHFMARHGLDKDLYAMSVRRNISYLKGLVDSCGDKFACYLDGLRRGGIVDALYQEGFPQQ